MMPAQTLRGMCVGLQPTSHEVGLQDRALQIAVQCPVLDVHTSSVSGSPDRTQPSVSEHERLRVKLCLNS